MAQVVVIGNIALDETLAVEAFPEPGASIAGSALSEGVGGKGANQAIAMARALAGVAPVRFVAAIGGDLRGARLRAGIEGEVLEARLISRDLPTDFSVILRDKNRENTIVTTQDCARSITGEEAVAVLAEYGPGDALVLQGNLRAETSLAVLEAAKARGIWRVLNPSPVEGCTAEMLAACDLLVVNEGEAETFGGAAHLSVGKVLVRTLGPRGAEVWQEGALVLKVAGVAVEALDPTGAGDCFLAALVAAMIRRGAILPEAEDLDLAAWAAGLCVSRLGTQSAFPTVAEFQAAFTA
ncbi:PfkB family carbohydrate kinase [Paracoccus aminophilus]|uniref:Ribokinase n=1 Tax=Paracoccus aminophilus JCM 7686 TaxID=1367847 RepID=S5YH53_PARAH|nr:PfkB family carbohydrate kinase [Paracoccus aminophilus]AGT10798.1 ribokinase [Paracoccus aminophilus JCM 7686]